MTALTFGALLLLSATLAAAVFGSVNAARAARKQRPGAFVALVGGIAVALAAGILVTWQVVHYFDIQDGTMNDPIGPFSPYLSLAAVLFACAALSGVVALTQMVITRRRATKSIG